MKRKPRKPKRARRALLRSFRSVLKADRAARKPGTLLHPTKKERSAEEIAERAARVVAEHTKDFLGASAVAEADLNELRRRLLNDPQALTALQKALKEVKGG